MELRDKVAVVTGGSLGIGFAIAGSLAREGAKVIAVARDYNNLQKAIESLDPAVRTYVTGMAADVRNENEVRSTIDEVVTAYGKIDILVNAAGVSMHDKQQLQDTQTADWQRIMDTNLTGTYLMSREALSRMKQRDDGFIVNILSTAAYKSSGGGSLYAASKFGARALTEAMIDENRRTGIRISSISPGAVDTNIWSHKTRFVPPEERATMLRAGQIADIAMYLLKTPATVHIENITVTPWYR